MRQFPQGTEVPNGVLEMLASFDKSRDCILL